MRESRKLDTERWIGALVAALAIAACAGSPGPTPTATPNPAPKAAPPAEAAPPPAIPREASPVGRATAVHVVRPGDTLTRIARNYAVDVADLVHVNDLPDADRIAPGQSLRIPAPSADADQAEALVEQAADHYRNARFDVALARAQQAQAILAARESSREAEPRGSLSARAAFIAGCALAAFGDDGRAVVAFSTVTALYPEFEPPEGWLSPRLEKLYLAAQK